jgi:hypothetical protein
MTKVIKIEEARLGRQTRRASPNCKGNRTLGNSAILGCPASGVYTDFWLHVRHDGVECRFPKQPTNRPTNPLPTLHVWTIGNLEYTATFDKYGVPATPPGQGWIRCNRLPPILGRQLRTDPPSKVWWRKALLKAWSRKAVRS